MCLSSERSETRRQHQRSYKIASEDVVFCRSLWQTKRDRQYLHFIFTTEPPWMKHLVCVCSLLTVDALDAR